MSNIRKMYENGMSTIEIAKELGSSHTTIRKKLMNEGVKLRSKRDAASKYVTLIYAVLLNEWLVRES